MLRFSRPEDKLPLKEILVNFRDDFCWAYAILDNAGVDAKTGIIAQPDIVEGNITIIVTEFQLGKLPLPNSVDDSIGKLLDIILKIEGPTDELPLEITGFEIDDGKFTIEGTVEVNK